MLTIGLTGGIGSGKSFVGKLLENLGYPVFYSDEQAKAIMIRDEKVMNQIQTLFGEEAYVDGSLNRFFLAEKIFHDESLKNQLNSIVHPAVRKAFDEFTKNNFQNGVNLVFNESAILFEIGRHTDFDYTILVTAPIEIRIQRVMNRDNITREQVESRINNQWSDEKKMSLADFIIENDGEQAITPQIEKILLEIQDNNSN